MKKLFCALLCLTGPCLLATPTKAQTFANGTLDTWVMRNGIEVPANWLVTNDMLPFLFPSHPGLRTNDVTKTTDARSGPFAARLQTTTISVGRATATTPASLSLGTRINQNFFEADGLPFAARPAELQFAYKLTGPQALQDSATVIVELTRTVGGTITHVAFGGINLLPTTTYALQSVPLHYSSSLPPDTARVIFLSGSGYTYTPGTVLQVDDVSFTGTATATRDAALNAAISVYPNPSADGRYVLSTTEASLLASPLAVLDATGRVVHREAVPNGAATIRTLNLSGLPSGIYTVQLFTSKGLVTHKLVH